MCNDTLFHLYLWHSNLNFFSMANLKFFSDDLRFDPIVLNDDEMIVVNGGTESMFMNGNWCGMNRDGFCNNINNKKQINSIKL